MDTITYQSKHQGRTGSVYQRRAVSAPALTVSETLSEPIQINFKRANEWEKHCAATVSTLFRA
jgi:hypothetical protein